MKHYIGIDLGGTNIAGGLVTEDAKLIEKLSVPTPAEGSDAVVDAIVQVVEALLTAQNLHSSDITKVGIGIPGTVSREEGTIIYCCNLPFEQNYPIARLVSERVGIPTDILNDASAAGYGEYEADETHPSSFIAITLGTGVGAGIVLDGKIYEGFNGAGGELGHTLVRFEGESCGCGRNGCWESYASASALVRMTKKAIEENPDSILAKLALERGEVNGKLTFDARDQGCASAKEVIDEYSVYVAEGLTNVINAFQPEKLVIGGGISNQGESFVAPIRDYVYEHGYNRYLPKTKIETAQLSNDAGIIGAALYQAE